MFRDTKSFLIFHLVEIQWFSIPVKAQKDYLVAQNLSTLTILGGLAAGSAIFFIVVCFVWYCKRRQYENNIKRRKVNIKYFQKNFSQNQVRECSLENIQREEHNRRKLSMEKRKTVREAREKVRHLAWRRSRRSYQSEITVKTFRCEKPWTRYIIFKSEIRSRLFVRLNPKVKLIVEKNDRPRRRFRK